jgi:hypothetical protein
MTNGESVAHRTRKSFVPPSDAIRAAALIDRQEALTEQYRCVGKASYRRRLEIEAELSAIRRDLERLGIAAGLPLARGRR